MPILTDALKQVRLQKVLAERGVASRRASSEIVRSGRVQVNGRIITEPGYRVSPQDDTILLDGRSLPLRPHSTRTIMMYKPRGYTCTHSRREGKNVFQILTSIPERVVCAGRLDKNSEGLLILSNDGALVQRLTHPRFGRTKRYQVTVSGKLNAETLTKLRRPLVIDGLAVQPVVVDVLRAGERKGRTVLEFVLKEGRKREIRRICSHANLRVHRLVRTNVGPLSVKGLKPGEWRDLTKPERKALETGESRA